MISCPSGLRPARLVEHITSSSSDLRATRSGWLTMTAGCASGQPGGFHMKISNWFNRNPAEEVFSATCGQRGQKPVRLCPIGDHPGVFREPECKQQRVWIVCGGV